MLQKSGRFAIGVTAPGVFSCKAKILHRALPIRSVFEMLWDPVMQLRPAPGRQPAIEHFTVKRMHKFVTRGDGPVRQVLRAKRTCHVMPARVLFAEVFKLLWFNIGCRSADPC